MDFFYKYFPVFILFVLTVLLNLPFGYGRAKSKKYSFKWFLYIHVPIPFVFLARTVTHIDVKFIPIFAFAAIVGQILGGKLEL